MSYEKDTRDAYKNKKKASAYKNQYIKGFKWARFTMWKQKKIIEKFLHFCEFDESKGKILDVPCGAGYIGDILSGLNAQIFASDISFEMIELAMKEYPGENFNGFLQSDITELPFNGREFTCSIILALMHRLPKKIRMDVLKEIIRVTSRYIIISYSIQNNLQKIKQFILSKINKNYLPAPAGIPMKEIEKDFSHNNLKIIKKKRVISFLSSKIVFLLEKN